MEINNKGKIHQVKNYGVQEQNAPTKAELAEALADVAEAAADVLEAKLRKEGKLP